MGPRVCGLLAIAACGRLGFSPAIQRDSDAASTGDAADDASPAACTPFDISLPRTSPVGNNIVWTGSKYLATASHQGMLAIVAIATDGTYTITDFAPAASTYLNGPQGGAVWTGDTLAVVWTINGELYLQFFDGEGLARGVAHPINGPGTPAASLVAWTGDRYGVIDATGGAQLAFREVNTSGAPLINFVQILPSIPDALLSVPNGYLIADNNAAPGAIRLVSHAGVITKTTTIALGEPISLVRAATGVLATGAFGGAFGFALLDDTGVTLQGPTALPAGPRGDFGDPIATASAHGIALIGETIAGTDHDVMRMELDAQGTVLVPPTVIGTFRSGAFGNPGGVTAPGRIAATASYTDLGGLGQLEIYQACE